MMAGNTYKGLAPDDDPRYGGGSTIITGANLNPYFVKKAAKPRTTRKRPARPPPRDEDPAPQSEEPAS